MSLFIEGNLKPKKGEPIPVNQFSDLVTQKGFEPLTVRAEI